MGLEQILIRRLSIAKYLYKLGVEQSLQSEHFAFTCLLSFHDSVEMYLKIAAQSS